MKKGLFVLLIFTCASIFANAQSPRVYTIPKEKLRDTALVNRFQHKAFIDSLRNSMLYWPKPNNNMPIAGAMPRRLIYLRNNQQGFDIYQTPHDNMHILKPDSSFASNMPVIKKYGLPVQPLDMPNPKKKKD